MTGFIEIKSDKIPTQSYIFSIEERKACEKNLSLIFDQANNMRPEDLSREQLATFINLKKNIERLVCDNIISKEDAIDAALKTGYCLALLEEKPKPSKCLCEVSCECS